MTSFDLIWRLIELLLEEKATNSKANDKNAD